MMYGGLCGVRHLGQDKTRVDRFVLDFFLFGDDGVHRYQIALSIHLRSVSHIIEESYVACVYGNVARVVYSRTFPSLLTPQIGRLNKSPHTVHAIANRHRWNLPQFAVIVQLRY